MRIVPAAACGLPAESDDALLGRVARGDTAAHRVLLDRHCPRVASFLRRRLRDADLREEVLSDVFLEVWRAASTYRGEASVASWIFGIARFRALVACRFQAQRKRAAVVPTPDAVIECAADHGAEESFAARDEMRRLLRALQTLPSGQRNVVTLAFFRDHSYQETAHILGISEANVKTRVKRARTRLRELMRAPSGASHRHGHCFPRVNGA